MPDALRLPEEEYAKSLKENMKRTIMQRSEMLVERTMQKPDEPRKERKGCW